MHKGAHTWLMYAKSWHVWLTLMFIVLPFLYVFVFAGVGHISAKSLFVDLGYSAYRMTVAFVIAVVLAWLMAIGFYRGKRAHIALPFFDVLQSFPTFAALPAAVALWGASDTTVIVFLVLTIIWPILFSLISGLRLIRTDWQDAVKIYQLTGWQYLRRFLLPVTLPSLIVGSIIGIGEGWEALIATEMISGTPTGLGQFFQMYSNNPTVTAFGILGFLIFIFCLNKLVWLSLLEWSHHMVGE